MNKVAAIQMCSSADVDENLRSAEYWIEEAASNGARLIVLPEMFAIMGIHKTDKVAVQESFGHGKIQQFLSEQARKYRVWIVGGTIPIYMAEAALAAAMTSAASLCSRAAST